MESREKINPPPPPPTGTVGTRIQLFLEKIAPLSNDLAAGGKRKAAALRKLRRLCETEVDKLRSGFALPTVKLYLSHYRNALRAIDPGHPAIVPRIDKNKQRFSYLALTRAETQQINAAYQTEIHKEQSQLMPLDPEATIQTALKLLSNERYLDIGIGLMLLTGRRPAEIFFAGDFSLPPKRTTVPTLIFSGQLKTRGSPNANVEPYPIPVLAEPKLILKHFRRMRELKPFPDADSVNNTVSVPLSFDVKRLFSPDWKPGHLRSAYAKIASHKFRPPHLGEDPYLAQILGHTLIPGRAPSYSVGQSYKDFYVKT